ncbi:SPOC domain-like protein [Trametes coccinea BRFM310]|uniref:ATP-dependent DNA helicase II subunit 2 n=1 Tax=Trametes coccinea (strain BRFM310) TaxID=1353009 RepID=A0A1Y2IWV6_TRAC3|nr:SPOC domain-like protein [Trametes coccinea BRFM310]
MFLVDISPSMGKMRQITVPGKDGGEPETIETTNLEWSLQYVMLKIQEMVSAVDSFGAGGIFNGRKTDKCGVILFGSEETKNVIHKENGGYEHVSEYIPIAQPNAATLAKLRALEPSTVAGDPIDALIVAIEMQDRFLGNKKTWTRKIVILTDGENPIEVEDWEATAKKMNALGIELVVVGVDFDDDDFEEEDKSHIKRENEAFYHTFTSELELGVVGNCSFALKEVSRPDVREVKSTATATVLRIGDMDKHPSEAVEITIKTAKATALARPKGFKKFARRKRTAEGEAAGEDTMDVDEDERSTFAQLQMRSEYYIEEEKAGPAKGEGSIAGSVNGGGDGEEKRLVKVEKEELVRGYKYGASFVPVPEEFARLPARRGMEMCGFFPRENFRREFSMGEVYYVFADPTSPMQQVALSSLVRAMDEQHVAAIARWTKTDKSDPKMGLLWPSGYEDTDCFLWVQMPFAEDVRNFPFASLETLINRKGEVVKEHPYLPTKEQMSAMADFVDAMDLMDAGEKDEDGNRQPWFDTRMSFNPAIHRTKQALFHAAVVQDLNTHPLPPPHPDLTKYFEPPPRALKRAKAAIEECKRTFNVREVPKKVARARKDEHVHAPDEDEEMLLLDRQTSRAGASQSQRATQSRALAQSQKTSPPRTQKKHAGNGSDSSETEPEPDIEGDEEELLLNRPAPGSSSLRPGPAPLPTPARSMSPDPKRRRDRAPGRIIGFTDPLEDFKKNLERGDVVTKAVEDLAFVIKDTVTDPSSQERIDEMIECMHELRRVCLEEDEIDLWNDFIEDLKNTCLETKPGNSAFWGKVRGIGRPLSLISQPEAAKAGGKSAIPESEAQKFIQD